MHMKIYDAICGNEGFRQKFPDIIENLLNSQNGTQQKHKFETELEDSQAAHALRILATLADKGNYSVLKQMKTGATNLIIKNIEAFVIQIIASDRWSKKYGGSTFDLVLALPELSKIIAVSARDVEIPMDPIIPRLSKVQLQNVHLYCFFNRAHAVRGRRISSIMDENSNYKVNPVHFRSFMRTCEDIETIGRGMALSYFTPFVTLGGLRLGFFFALIGEVTDSGWVRSPTGFGFSMDQVRLTLTDKTGNLEIRMNNEIFVESLNNPMQPKTITIKNPLDLSKSNEKVFVVGVWVLGKAYPEIAFLTLLENNLTLETWCITSFLNTHRKIPRNLIDKIGGERLVEIASKDTGFIFNTNIWTYYKERVWPKELFCAIVDNGFIYHLQLPVALKYGASYWDFKVWTNKISRFFKVNPHLLELYRSDKPLDLFKKMHSILEKEKKAATKYPIENQQTPMISFFSTKKFEITHLAMSLSKLGYTAWDLFSPEWDNGGYALEKMWLHASSGHLPTLNELFSALSFILSMRGEVKVPAEASRGKQN